MAKAISWGVTQFYLQPDINEHNPTLTPEIRLVYSIYPPRKDGRLS